MESHVQALAFATSATAEQVAVLLAGSALSARPCPTPAALRRARADVRPIAAAAARSAAPARTRGLGAIGGGFGFEAWTPGPAIVDQTIGTSVLFHETSNSTVMSNATYTSDVVTHHPGDRALRPPV